MGDQIYPSVTTVLGSLPKPELDAWKQRVGQEEVDLTLARASARGTRIHKLLEDYIDNKLDTFGEEYSQMDIDNFQSLQPIIDQRVGRVFCQEATLYSDRLRVAGRMDLLAEWDGEIAVIDFKTSTRPKTEAEIQNYFIQESIYAAAILELRDVPVKQIVTLMMVDFDKPLVFVKQPFDYLRAAYEARDHFRNLYNI